MFLVDLWKIHLNVYFELKLRNRLKFDSAGLAVLAYQHYIALNFASETNNDFDLFYFRRNFYRRSKPSRTSELLLF